MKIGIKLTTLFIAISVLSISIIGWIAYSEGKKSLETESFNRLTAVREMKASQIEDYFRIIENQIVSYSLDYTVIEAMKNFKKDFYTSAEQFENLNHKDTTEWITNKSYYENEFIKRLNANSLIQHNSEEFLIKNKEGALLQRIFIANNPNPVGEKHNLTLIKDSIDYAKTHSEFHPLFKDFLTRFGYYDIFLIDNIRGDIVYSVFKEVDFGTSLKDGPFSKTNLAKVFETAVGSNDKSFVSVFDYEPYEASYNSPASFIGTPIFDNDVCIGVLVFQMPIDVINNIMTNNENWSDVGLGKSGETYLVSDDYTLRNQSRFLIESPKEYFKMIKDINVSDATINKIKTFNSCIGLQEVKTEGTIAALKGESDTRIFEDYRGVEVLSSFKPLNIKGLNWVIMSEIDKSEAFAPITKLRNNILIFFVGTLIMVLVVSFFASKMITKPIKSLTKTSRELARGNWDVEVRVNQKDEIGILALSFKSMQNSLHKLVDDLQEINHNLEEKVNLRTQELKVQKDLMEEKNIEILDSIHYAQRLQSAILPTQQFIYENLNDSFVLFLPKDIVSGDFYWMVKKGDEILVAAVDCTGHGVPGAMVSLVGANSLNRCVNEFGLINPAEILNKLRELVIETFNTSDEEIKDGMDMSLVIINKKTLEINFAGANNPLWIARKEEKEFEIIKSDKQPIGRFDYAKPFTNNKIQLKKGDCIYLFTDGYADQFGGTKGKKLKYKPLQDMMLQNIHLPMHKQQTLLENAFKDWMADFEQVDDVCIIGVRI